MGDRRARALILFRRAAVLLLLGAIVNVAVAWGFALAVPMDATWVFRTVHQDVALWPLNELEHQREGFLSVAQWQRLGSTRVQVFAGNYYEWPEGEATGSPIEECPSWGRERILTTITELTEENDKAYLTFEARGWPARALWCQPAEENALDGTVIDPPVGGIQVDERFAAASDRFTQPTLPLQPIWLGLAFNTLFYSGMLWMIFTVLAALRRRSRVRRGLCPACAYPVGASSICTECGKPVKARRVEPASS